MTRTVTTKSTRLRSSLVSVVDVKVEKEAISSEDRIWTWDFHTYTLLGKGWKIPPTAINWPLCLVSMSYAKTNIFNWCGEVAAGRWQGPLNFPRCWRQCEGDHFCNLVQSLIQSFLDFHQSLWKCNSSDYLILLIIWFDDNLIWWLSDLMIIWFDDYLILLIIWFDHISTFSFFLNPSSEVLHLSSREVRKLSFNPRYSETLPHNPPQIK